MLLHKHLDIQQKAGLQTGLLHFTTIQTIHVKLTSNHLGCIIWPRALTTHALSNAQLAHTMEHPCSDWSQQCWSNMTWISVISGTPWIQKPKRIHKKNTSPESQEKFHADVGSVLMSLDQSSASEAVWANHRSWLWSGCWHFWRTGAAGYQWVVYTSLHIIAQSAPDSDFCRSCRYPWPWNLTIKTYPLYIHSQKYSCAIFDHSIACGYFPLLKLPFKLIWGYIMVYRGIRPFWHTHLLKFSGGKSFQRAAASLATSTIIIIIIIIIITNPGRVHHELGLHVVG